MCDRKVSSAVRMEGTSGQVEKGRVKLGLTDVEASNRCEWRSGVFRLN